MQGRWKVQPFAVASEIFWYKSLFALEQRRTNMEQLGTTIENTRFIRIIVEDRISGKYNEPIIAYILLVGFPAPWILDWSRWKYSNTYAKNLYYCVTCIKGDFLKFR